MSFRDLGLSEKVQSAVASCGYETPTPIQEKAIPHVLEGRDVLGLAQTGTGKTASFTLPMLTRLEKGRARARMPRNLILEPTRELAAQVQENFDRYGINHKLTVALLIGGVSFDEQDRKLTKGADVLIATPGRLLDHFERGRLLLTGVETLVIDEADRMLDMGFIPDIERIVKLIPFTRQTLLFSATMPSEIDRLASQFLQNPVRIEAAKRSSAAETVEQQTIPVGSKPNEKREALRGAIDGAEGLKNAIIFCNRKRDVATLFRSLERHGYSVGSLHGDMDQHARLKTLEAFRDNEITLLVASDVAARGLDIPDVSHVFNYDVPTHAEDYIHRIGRTGRAGRKGIAIMLISPADKKYVQAIEKLLDKAFEATGAAPSRSSGKMEGEGEGRPRRRRRGKTKEKTPESVASDASGDADAVQPDQPADDASSAEERPKKRATNRQGKDRQRQREEKSSDVVFGESEYVPAFLLRPVKSESLEPAEAA